MLTAGLLLNYDNRHSILGALNAPRWGEHAALNAAGYSSCSCRQITWSSPVGERLSFIQFIRLYHHHHHHHHNFNSYPRQGVTRYLYVCLLSSSHKTTDQILMKILPEMNLWTRKSPLSLAVMRIWI